MERREELRLEEENAWGRLVDTIALLSPAQREEPKLTPAAWSAKDIVWHCASWCNEAASGLEEMRDSVFREEAHSWDAEQTDARNDVILAESRTMTWGEVTDAADRARRRVLDALEALVEVDEIAESWFADETFLHYLEHLEAIPERVEDGPRT